jgi:hypothetical protein
MPMNPQTIEVSAPMMKAQVVKGKVTPAGSTVKNKRIEKARIKPNRKVYSCLRKVIAPY